MEESRRARDGRIRLALAVAAGLALAALAASCTPTPLAPLPGIAHWEEIAALPLRDGLVNLAGGNLLARRTDLTIETRLGPQAVTHVYNSATDRWRWSFETSYAGGVFTDESGAVHALAALAPGAIPGTRWKKVDAATLETRGGLRYAFGPDGRLASVAFRHAAFPRLEWRREGATLRIVQCTGAGACGDVFVVTYAGEQVTSIVDRAGRRCDYGYASDGRLAFARNAFEREEGLPGRRYAYALHPDGRTARLSVRSSEEEEARYELDAEGRLLAQQLVGEEQPVWRFEHRMMPWRTVVTDPLGRSVEWEFDSARRLVRVDYRAVSEQTRIEWTGLRPTRVTRPDGLSTSARYDAADQLVELTLASGRRVQIAWPVGAVNLRDPGAALPARIWDSLGDSVVRTFDTAGRLVSERNGAGDTTRLHYGPLETLARVELPDGREVRLAGYGEHGQPTEATVPSGDPELGDFVETRSFDAVGNLTGGADPGRMGTEYPGVVGRSFDAARNVRSLVMADDGHGNALDVVFSYRSDGRLRAIRRPYGADAEYAYDGLGRLREHRERVDGAWQRTSFAYTPLGELARRERANGMVQELDYDGAGRRVRMTHRRGSTVESELRYVVRDGRLVRKEDASGPRATELGYDAQGRVRSVTWPDGEQSWWSYDERDRPTTLVLLRSDGQLLRQLGLRYDAADRETRALDGSAVIHESVYENGRLAAVREGNGIVRTLSVDGFGRPSAAVSRDAAGVELEAERVEREAWGLGGPDPNGLFRTTTARYAATAPFGPVATFERSFGLRFPPGQRWVEGIADSGLVEWCRTEGCQTGADRFFFQHSALMDVRAVQLPSGADPDPVTRVFEKNPERNRLRRIVRRRLQDPGSPEVVEHTYAWDAAGFATSRNGVAIAWTAGGRLASFGADAFTYDGEGRLRSATVAGITTRRLFGGLVEADAAGAPASLDLRAVAIDLRANTRLYRHFDFRGNVKSTWDDAGRIRSVVEYGPYGVEQVHGDPSDRRGFAQGEGAGDLVVLGARVYDPAAAEFLSPDPVYHVLHQYAYAAGDPINWWDAGGLEAEPTPGFVLAGSFGRLVGTAIVVGIGAAVALLTPGGWLAGGVITTTLGSSMGEFGKALAEYIYLEVAKKPKYEDPSAAAVDLTPISIQEAPAYGPGFPGLICGGGGECMWSWWPFRGSSTPHPPRLMSASPFSLNLNFAPAPAFACGLLGVEVLPWLAWILVRRTRRVPR